MSVTNQFGQTFYEEEAMLLFPEGCTCGPDPGGDCPFCQIYYGEVQPHTENVEAYTILDTALEKIGQDYECRFCGAALPAKDRYCSRNCARADAEGL